jgi:hypothetical protein
MMAMATVIVVIVATIVIVEVAIIVVKVAIVTVVVATEAKLDLVAYQVHLEKLRTKDLATQLFPYLPCQD